MDLAELIISFWSLASLAFRLLVIVAPIPDLTFSRYSPSACSGGDCVGVYPPVRSAIIRCPSPIVTFRASVSCRWQVSLPQHPLGPLHCPNSQTPFVVRRFLSGMSRWDHLYPDCVLGSPSFVKNSPRLSMVAAFRSYLCGLW